MTYYYDSKLTERIRRERERERETVLRCHSPRWGAWCGRDGGKTASSILNWLEIPVGYCGRHLVRGWPWISRERF